MKSNSINDTIYCNQWNLKNVMKFNENSLGKLISGGFFQGFFEILASNMTIFHGHYIETPEIWVKKLIFGISLGIPGPNMQILTNFHENYPEIDFNSSWKSRFSGSIQRFSHQICKFSRFFTKTIPKLTSIRVKQSIFGIHMQIFTIFHEHYPEIDFHST